MKTHPKLHPSRPWLPPHAETYIKKLETHYESYSADQLEQAIQHLTAENQSIHEQQSINLNPATNVMNPKAEALLSSGLGTRPSLGYPGDKYEMGLEAIEKLEVIAAQLACEVFKARYGEIRIGSGALANLYTFMATTQPGDSIIVPPAEIGGHVTHHLAGAAGLYGLKIHMAPIDAKHYTIDTTALREQVKQIRPKLLTIGGSLNLLPHPVRELRAIADEYECYLHFDAAHLCGLIAGGVWQQPLAEGAHTLSFSTYKSLGGPPAGLLLTNDTELARRIDKIAFPGLTANYDASKSAALAMTLLDWKTYGKAYASTMVETANALAYHLNEYGLPLFKIPNLKFTTSHQFAIHAAPYGGGQTMAKHLRKANILTCGIGLPGTPLPNDLTGLRIGTPEIVRWGMGPKDMPELATFFKRIFITEEAPEQLAEEVSDFKKRFQKLHFIRT